MELYNAIKQAGIEHDSHESDLYIPVSRETRSILETYPHRANIQTFRSQIDGKLWFDVPFAYLPFWTRKQA